MPVQVTLQNNISELDSLLLDLSNARYTGQEGSATYTYGDYCSDTDTEGRDRDKPNNKFTQPTDSVSLQGATLHNYSNTQTLSSVYTASLHNNNYKRHKDKITKTIRIKADEQRRYEDESDARDDETREIDDGADYDYSSKWDYLGKGIWENQDYCSMSNYGTVEEWDYDTVSTGFVSEEELEKETGAGPRGERSKVIETENGAVESKYRYMGFGLWENTDPGATKKQKKPRAPPPPTKAEPIVYTCTVSVTKHISSKELDDLAMDNKLDHMGNGQVEVCDGVGDLGGGVEEPGEMFEKEDMSDMFRRAMLEQMELVDEPPAKYQCFVCSNLISGRIITAMGNKFHPQCFVCTYCRKEFKDRKYKTDPRENKPYCFKCFEKLLGHFGNAHGLPPFHCVHG